MNSTGNNIAILNSPGAMITQPPGDFGLAWRDLVDGLANYQFWTFMGFAEIRRRYRRTVIGPFWTTLSLGVFIACMGYLLSVLWHTNAKEFLPYFCSGYIAWILLQTIILESCSNFTNVALFMRQISLPFTTYACIVAWRNVIVFLHHLVILALVLMYAGVPLNTNMLLLVPALWIIFFTGTWVGILLGMLCARFRDMQQVITSLLQLAMYVTPIMWQPEQLGSKAQLIMQINPLCYFVDIIRLPLIGQAPSAATWAIAGLISICGAGLTLIFLGKNYRKIVFWL